MLKSIVPDEWEREKRYASELAEEEAVQYAKDPHRLQLLKYASKAKRHVGDKKQTMRVTYEPNIMLKLAYSCVYLNVVENRSKAESKAESSPTHS